MEEKQIVVSPRCPTHGWIDASGYTRPTEERSPCVRFVEASRDGNYFIREANFERSHILEEIVQPEPQPQYAPTGDLNYVTFDTTRLQWTYATGDTTPISYATVGAA